MDVELNNVSSPEEEVKINLEHVVAGPIPSKAKFGSKFKIPKVTLQLPIFKLEDDIKRPHKISQLCTLDYTFKLSRDDFDRQIFFGYHNGTIAKYCVDYQHVDFIEEGNVHIEHEVLYFLCTKPEIILFVTKNNIIGYNFREKKKAFEKLWSDIPTNINQIAVTDTTFFLLYASGAMEERYLQNGEVASFTTAGNDNPRRNSKGTLCHKTKLLISTPKGIYISDTGGSSTREFGEFEENIAIYGNYLLGWTPNGNAYCASLKTNQVLWKQNLKAISIVIEKSNLYVLSKDMITIYKLETGKELATGKIYTRSLFFVDVGTVYALDMFNEHLSRYQFESTDVLWSYPFLQFSTLQISGDHVYMANGYSFKRFELRDGRAEEDFTEKCNTFIISKSGMIYIATMSNIVQYELNEMNQFLVNREKTKPPPSIKGKLSFSDRSWNPIQLTFNQDQTMLFSIAERFSQVQQWDLMSMSLVATYSIPHNSDDDFPTTMLVNDETLYIGDGMGTIHMFSIETGDSTGQIRPPNVTGAARCLLCYENKLFLQTSQGEVYAWKNKECQRICSHKVQDKPVGYMAIYHNHLYVAVTDIYVYDLDTFQVIKEYEIGTGRQVLCLQLFAEKLVISTYDQILCVSLLMTEANTDHLACMTTMQSYCDYVALNHEKLSKYRDSRGNSFLIYATGLATDDQIDVLFTNYTTFNFFEPNQYGLSPFILILTQMETAPKTVNMAATDEEKHLISNQAYIDQLLAYLTNKMYDNSVIEYINYMTSFYRQASIMQLSFRLLSICAGTHSAKLFPKFMETLKTHAFIDEQGNSLVHIACARGEVDLLKALLAMDDIQPQDENKFGQTPLHLALSLPPKLNLTSFEQDARLIRTSAVYIKKLECAIAIININSMSKKPNMFKASSDGITHYDAAVSAYYYSSQEMKKKRDEYKDKTTIAQAKEIFKRTNEIVETVHEKYTQTQTKRKAFAFKMFMAEAVHYVIFLILLSSLAFLNFSRNDQNDYYFTKSISDTLNAGLFTPSSSIQFTDIITGDQVYEWLTDTLLSTIYLNETNEVFYNRFVGSVRLKQVRVVNYECMPTKSMNPSVDFCYTKDPIIDKSPFGPDNMFVWTDDSQESGFVSAFNHHYYSSGGFIQDISLDVSLSDSIAVIDRLQTNNWIDKSTRAIVISSTLYNSNLDRLGAVQMMVEFLVGGEAFPSYKITPIKAKNINGSEDYIQAALEIICLIYILTEFVYREILEIKNNVKEGNFIDNYLAQSWNYYEWSIIALSIVVAVFRVYNRASLGLLDYSSYSPYINFQSLADRVIAERSLFSVLLVLCFLRGLKLLRIPPSTGPVTQSIMDTLKARTVLVFMGLFILVIFSFSIAFSVAFGSDVYGYRTIGNSFITLIRIAFGDINYDELESANYVLGPILFITFIFFITLIMMNLVVAILSEVYIAIQGKNEAAWERYITKLYIDNFQKPNAFFLTKLMRQFIEFSEKLFERVTSNIKRKDQEIASKQIEYEEEDLDSLAEKLREIRLSKSTNDVYNEIANMKLQIAELQKTMNVILEAVQKNKAN